MNHQLAIFNYEGLTVRTIEKGGDLRFVAKNVAACALVRRQGGPVTNHLLSRHSNPPKQK